MITLAFRTLVEQASKHCEMADSAIQAGDMDAAQAEMKALSEKYQAFCAESADESPEQQQDNAEEKESTDEKGSVGDSPHIGHCVHS